MTKRATSFLAIAAIAASMAVMSGCRAEYDASAQSIPTRSDLLRPAPGTSCTVHFSRDALGVADKQPIPIGSGNHNGADLTVSGKFSRMDGEWLVLTKPGKSEVWVARSKILYINVLAP